MKYMGSKARIAKHLLPIILKDRSIDQWYVEPFVGGANMIDKVEGRRIGADSNAPLVACLDALSKKWLPMEKVSEAFFNKVKSDNSIVDPPTLGYIGTQLTFGAMWFSGYRKDKQGDRNYSDEAFRHVKKQAPKLYGVTFKNCPYWCLEIPPDSIVYCDPPYANTAKYKAVGEFNHGTFWQWCRDKVKEGHKVFISEYTAPDDFKCIWSKELNVSFAKNGEHKKAIERLFIHNSQI